MIGITSYGVHIPFYRLSRQTISEFWSKGGGKGEKAVAGPDEDTITMAVQACGQCIEDIDKEDIDALYFASLTPPYVQKQSSSIISAALNLKRETSTLDFSNSIRVGTGALKAALDAVKAGSAKKILVVASDAPMAHPDSLKELEFGDGAAAFVIGDSDVAVNIEGSCSITSEFMDIWRLPQDRFSQEWEDRFIRDEGYMRLLPQLVSTLLKKYNLKPEDFDRVVYNGIEARSHQVVAKKMGFDYQTQVQDPLYNKIGNTDSASALMILLSALEEAKPGERILLANYGDGGDAYILRVTEDIENLKKKKVFQESLNSMLLLPSYGKYQRFKKLVELEIDRRPAPRTSPTHYFRESKQLFGLLGQRCKTCGHEQFPRQRICMWCYSRMEKPEEYDDVPLATQKGRLFTFSMDERAPVDDLPNVLCVVDLEGGARFYGLMTDRDTTKLEIGQEMEFVFRKINDGQGVHNYFWKVRPVKK
jgi:hydroxymethylglutaryl-CoA synthase